MDTHCVVRACVPYLVDALSRHLHARSRVKVTRACSCTSVRVYVRLRQSAVCDMNQSSSAAMIVQRERR